MVSCIASMAIVSVRPVSWRLSAEAHHTKGNLVHRTRQQQSFALASSSYQSPLLCHGPAFWDKRLHIHKDPILCLPMHKDPIVWKALPLSIIVGSALLRQSRSTLIPKHFIGPDTCLALAMMQRMPWHSILPGTFITVLPLFDDNCREFLQA